MREGEVVHVTPKGALSGPLASVPMLFGTAMQPMLCSSHEANRHPLASVPMLESSRVSVMLCCAPLPRLIATPCLCENPDDVHMPVSCYAALCS